MENQKIDISGIDEKFLAFYIEKNPTYKNLQRALYDYIDDNRNPKDVSKEEIIGALTFQTKIKDKYSYKLMGTLALLRTQNVATGEKSRSFLFLPAEAFIVLFLFTLYGHLKMDIEETEEVFGETLEDSCFDKKMKQTISMIYNRCSIYDEDNVKYLSYSVYNPKEKMDDMLETDPSSYHSLFFVDLVENLIENKNTKEDENRLIDFRDALSKLKKNIPLVGDILMTHRKE